MLVAGTTVVIAVLGLFVMGASYLNGVALAASLSVLVVMAAALTLLPAFLAFAGRGSTGCGSPGWTGRRPQTERHTLAARWSRPSSGGLAGRDSQRPCSCWPRGAGPRVAARVPGRGQRPARVRPRATRTGSSAAGFGPGANGTLLLAAELSGRDDRRSGPARCGGRSLRARRGRGQPAAHQSGGDTAVLTVVPPTTTPQDSRPATSSIGCVTSIPAATSGTGTEVDVGGLNAVVVDQSDLSSRLPLFIAAVVGLSFLLLLAAFRSPLIALKAGVMNLLSVGAAYGVLALSPRAGWSAASSGSTPTRRSRPSSR